MLIIYTVKERRVGMTGPKVESYWENWSIKARRTNVMLGQEPLEHHPTCTPSWFLYLGKDEERADSCRQGSDPTVEALLCKDRGSKMLSLL